ncbi:MAG: hypothetical protein Q8K85_07560, partial [Hyphomicrobium sp.]|nr:hypothetical protein [Hyphomicrobium sp.]
MSKHHWRNNSDHHHTHDHDDDDHDFNYGFFDNRYDLSPVILDATLDVTATDGNGHTLNGSGNPATGWEIQNQGAFQLAADVHYRQGDTVQPVAVNDDGVLIYNMPAGAQVVDPAHGVSTANANRAATSFDFSFDTGVG